MKDEYDFSEGKRGAVLKKDKTCGDCFRCQKATDREKVLTIPDVCREKSGKLRVIDRDDPECDARTRERKLERVLEKAQQLIKNHEYSTDIYKEICEALEEK
jgi:hypothetical protein